MTSNASTPIDYIKEQPDDRKKPLARLRSTIIENLPPGFEESMSYGMIAYQVPLSIYPEGYHAGKGSTPLPFINLANQKNYIALYHMGIYADPKILHWFKEEYAKRVTSKLDMGKSCIRFKKMDAIPYDLITELCGKISVAQWIATYENQTNQ